MAVLFNSSGDKVKLAKKIGSGGEGNVYKLTSKNKTKTAAKIWHEKKPLKKQNKIRIMAKDANESLRKVTAWPLDTLHKTKGGDVVGFIMPDITGYSKLHDFYNPSNRKRKHPNINWEFLISICRNIAASFATIHAKNHVIGDVNPGLIFVSPKTITKFVDCDSFQIIHNGVTYPCRVGVQNFTPPELQKTKDFSKVLRTKNHDNFGLSLLIFHILMMGRHPFSGVYSGNTDMELRVSIQKYLYAYSKNPTTGAKIKPPPKSLPIDILPNEIQLFFEKAFSQSGSLFNRPTAKEWIKVLDNFRSKLKKCSKVSAHTYYNKSLNCPWCALEGKGIAYFKRKSFNIDKVYDDIKSIEPVKIIRANIDQKLNEIKNTITPKTTSIIFPKLFKAIKKQPFSILISEQYSSTIPESLKAPMPKPLVFSIEDRKVIKKEKKKKIKAAIIMSIVAVSSLLSYFDLLFSFNIILLTVQIIATIFAFELFIHRSKAESELTKRKMDYKNKKDLADVAILDRDKKVKLIVTQYANSIKLTLSPPIKAKKIKLSEQKSSSKNHLNNLIKQWKDNADEHKIQIFKGLKRDLKSSYSNYKNIKPDYNAELHEITSKARERQFDYYMNNTYIINWKIKGIGPKKISALRSYGIQTASDVWSSTVDRVPGFGEKHTQTMLNWKYQVERSFTFNPNNTITPSQDRKLKGKYLKIKTNIERKFSDALNQLEQINKIRLQKNDDLLHKINKAMHKSAQADADWEEFKKKYLRT